MRNGFTLIELLVVVTIVGVLAAVGVTAFSNFIENARVSATKENHVNISNLIKTKAVMCKLNDIIQYTNLNGTISSINCKPSIDQFINIMNQSTYGMNFRSPFGPTNASWCRINVTNCSPPGYMRACPTHPDQGGYISIFKLNNTTIRVCSNLGRSTGSTQYMQTEINYF